DVNLEPRWSPDGSRIAFVSTRDTGRFHVFVGALQNGKLDAAQLVAERKSAIERYYYSAYDHELSPTWSADGDSLMYVANPEIPYGTGAIWRKSLLDDSEPELIRKEETTWKARPDWAPDGKRVIYSSYLGRQWHQLWMTHVDGIAEPFPLTYGEFDVTAARWSPDGKRIAYVANEAGNTEIRIQEFIGGRTTTLTAEQRQYLQPMASLELSIVSADGKPMAARVAIVAADGRSYAPDAAWLHADDSFDRDKSDVEAQYFHIDGKAMVTLPPGEARVTVWRGPEHEIAQQRVNVAKGADNQRTIALQQLPLPDAWQDPVSGDVHVHMNYGGTYRATPQSLIAQAEAEDLDVVFNLIVNKEQRVPDIAYFSTQADKASTDDTLLLHSQEFHTSFWGHLGILGLESHLLVPDYSAYPATGAASLFPDNTTVAQLAHKQGALVGYVHPFLSPPPDPVKDAKLTNALPIDAALGLVDYYEVVGFADHRASAEVWYGLLNCGMRIAAAGGTDAMSNYASLRGPVGINRTYVPVANYPGTPEARRAAWLAGLKAGKSLATNGPLLGLTVEGVGPGEEIQRSTGTHELKYSGFLRSSVPVDHLELVHNGKVMKTFKLDRARRAVDISGTIAVSGSGWLLLRAWNDKADPLIFDLYPYASTSPV
ncbi:MAG: CehA/McbA family metallohydrolase, partial [Woeseia sp.]